MDIVFIENLEISGKFGITDTERQQHQKLRITIEALCDISPVFISGSLHDTVSYSQMKKDVLSVLASQPYFILLETLAQKIADRLLLNKKIASLTITIRKVDIWPDGVPGIKLVR